MDRFWPEIGGVETYSLQFLQGMVMRGHECLVLAQKCYPDWKEEAVHEGLQIKRFDFDSILKKDLSVLPKIRNYLEWVVKEFRPDIIHLHTEVGGSVFVFLLFVQMFSMPIVFTVHAVCLYEGKILPFSQKLMASVDRMICVSKWIAAEVGYYYPSFKHKLGVIYNGLLFPQTVPSPLPFSPPMILILSRFVVEKGIEVAIEAFCLLKKSGSDARLMIVGEGPERFCLEQLVAEKNLKPFVKFTGKVRRDREDVFSIINQATFVVMPSYAEPFGLVALEAMQMGRPVIGSRSGGLPEVIADLERGLLVPTKDPTALYEAMKTLLDDPGKTMEMGRRCRKWAEKNHSLEENLDQYERLFEECRSKILR